MTETNATRAAGSSAPACSPSDLEVSQRREKMWRDECTRIVNALADLAELPRDPCPGWQPCIKKIKAIMANAAVEARRDAIASDGLLADESKGE